jgi:hypothetical protein
MAVVGPLAAAVVLGAEGRVSIDLLVRRLRVPEEVARRVDGDHHRPVDAVRVAPRVDHRGAGADALAQEVDALVAECAARRLEIVDPLGQRVSGEVDAVVLEPVCAGTVGVGVRAQRLLGEEVGPSA